MDPLSIAASAVSLLGFVAKAVTSIAGFSRTARDANDDLDALIKELLLLRSLLEELARDFAASQRGFSVPDGLLRQVHTNISGCSMVVEQVVELVEKYQKDSAWTKSKWVLFGQGDVRKLKISVEAYKSAISIGMLIISKTQSTTIEENSEAIREDARATRMIVESIIQNDVRLTREASLNNTIILEQILARTLISQSVPASRERVIQWVEDMEALSLIAEEEYQATISDPEERGSRPASPESTPIQAESSPRAKEPVQHMEPRPIALDRDKPLADTPAASHQDINLRRSKREVTKYGSQPGKPTGFSTSTPRKAGEQVPQTDQDLNPTQKASSVPTKSFKSRHRRRQRNGKWSDWSEWRLSETNERYYKQRQDRDGNHEIHWATGDYSEASRKANEDVCVALNLSGLEVKEAEENKVDDADTYQRGEPSRQLPADYYGRASGNQGHESPDPGRVGIEGCETLDSRYKVEPYYRFQPGKIFDLLWPEPIGVPIDGTESITDTLVIKNKYGESVYVSFRRFIVIGNDIGHCQAVPILTYGGKGCSKRGVKPEKHGIIYIQKSSCRRLPDEPMLGFPPVRLVLEMEGEDLAEASRVNYSKIVTVEHNVKVFFIGHVYPDDFQTVSDAVNHSWEDKVSRRKKQHNEQSGRQKDLETGNV